MQKEGAQSHTSSTQDPEQQLSLLSQALPEVLQLLLSGAQLPSVQLLPQHWSSLVQTSPSEVQLPELAQLPPIQLRLSQSVGPVQPAPGSPPPVELAQVLSDASQSPEQHMPPYVQYSAKPMHVSASR